MRPLIAILAVLGLAACGGGQSSRPQPSYENYNETRAPHAAPTEAQAASREQIRAAQQTLKDGGFYTGQVDGVWGPATQDALSRYQTAHNLPATGKLDQPTQDVMRQPPPP